MSKKCELTGKNPLKGHNVSHANNKTKRKFLPNLKKVKFTSELLKRSLKLTVSNAGVRFVDNKGSFDQFLKNVKSKIEIIGVGGVDSGESAHRKFLAGASYVQLYTGMVFQGPNIVGKIKKELKEILITDGIENFREIIGKKQPN